MEIHASLRAEDIFIWGPIHLTNSMVMAWMTVVLLAIVGFFAGRNPQLIPSGLQNVFEAFLEAILNLVENTAGHYARRVFPLIATLFLFIITANYLGLIPGVGTINVPNPHVYGDAGHAAPAKSHAFVKAAEAAPSGAAQPPGGQQLGEQGRHEPDHVPLLRAANADVNMTFGMGLVAFFFIHASGMIVHGAWGYIKNDIAKPLFLTPIKVVIEAFLPVSLSMRLFGNVFGGEMLLTVMGFPVVAVIFMFAELFFGFIQALIFSILTLIFTSLAVYVAPGHGAHGDEHGTTDEQHRAKTYAHGHA
jgi:F-type H+-transporting ATPase subunit a